MAIRSSLSVMNTEISKELRKALAGIYAEASWNGDRLTIDLCHEVLSGYRGWKLDLAQLRAKYELPE